MRHIKIIKPISLIILLFLITSCSNNSAMKPEDFKNKEPRLIIEEYLSGNVKAWGVLQNRSGKVTRQFSADLNGTWDGKQLILKEKFNWDDGEVQDREWTITKIDEHNYEGTAGDVVGKAIGYSYGPAFKFEYVLLVPVKGKELKIYSVGEGIRINNIIKKKRIWNHFWIHFGAHFGLQNSQKSAPK